MASYITTTAVAIRKGDTVSNMNFTGVLAEVTADLGYEEAGTLGVDGNVTLRVHNGITKGGIPLCRADTRNITTKALAENRGLIDDKNLAYADLSNIEKTEDAEAINDIVTTLGDYGIVNTDQLAEEVSKLALKDMSNVITSTLTTGRGRGENGNLAYADTSNVNTADLVDSALHYGKEAGDWPLAYANVSNVNTTNLTLEIEDRPATMNGPVLATNTFSNITKDVWQGNLFNPENELNLERTTNKVTYIPLDPNASSAEQYPNSQAVIKYVDEELTARQYLKTDYSNSSSYELLYKTSEKLFKYVPGEVVSGSHVFETGQYYYTGIDLTGEFYDFAVRFATDSDESIDDTVFEPVIPFGKENLDGKEIDIIAGGKRFVIRINALLEADNLYHYTCTTLVDNDEVTAEASDKYYPTVRIPMQKLLLVKITGTNEAGQITEFECVPQYGEVELETDLFILGMTSASVKIGCEYAIQSGLPTGGLAKTNLTNLTRMSDTDISAEQDSKWRIRSKEAIQHVSNNKIAEDQYFTIATNGLVWDLVKETEQYVERLGGMPDWKANTAYIISPYHSKVLYNGDVYWCKEAHTSGNTFDASKWERVFNNTYEYTKNKDQNISLYPDNTVKFPTNKAVVDYVKEQIDAVHIPGHYHGQVDIMVPTENELPGNGTYAEYAIELREGLTALVAKYTVTNSPVIATYTAGAWKYEELVLQNGVYVYVLNLGKTYYDGPGNATWNATTESFDISPDKFQVPDGISLDLNSSTGAIQIVPRLQTQLSYLDVSSSLQNTVDDLYAKIARLNQEMGAMVIPAPQFFTANNTVGQQLVLTDDVAFDLYVNGVFQYPNQYTYDSATKTITLNFAAEDVQENGIAVIYRGFRTLK